MACEWYDVACSVNSLIDWLLTLWNDFSLWLYSLFQFIISIINIVINGLIGGVTAIISFVVSMYSLLSTVVSFLTGFLEIFNVNPTAGLIIATILMIISLIIFIRIYNILADIEIFGWKLPRIPI